MAGRRMSRTRRTMGAGVVDTNALNPSASGYTSTRSTRMAVSRSRPARARSCSLLDSLAAIASSSPASMRRASAIASLEDARPGVVAQHQVRAEVIGPQDPQQLRLGVRDRPPVAGHSEAECGAAHRTPVRAELAASPVSMTAGVRPAWRMVTTCRMRCPSVLSNGKPEGQRRGIRLEVGVGPVAMVLELHQVALDGDDRLGPVHDLDGHLPVGREHARQRPVDDALRVDGGGQHTSQLAGLRLRRGIADRPRPRARGGR